MILMALVVLTGFSVHAQFTRAELQATGLTCAMCSNAIYKALMEVPFVESVTPDIKNSGFGIKFKAVPAAFTTNSTCFCSTKWRS